MMKSGVDPQALAEMFASASAKQTTQLRQAVYDSTLRALQGRELSLKNIRKVLDTVAQAASAGAAQNPAAPAQVEKMLDTAVAGMDDALLKAVEANRVALQQFVDRGVDLRETQLKKALGDLEKMEDQLFGAVKKATGAAGEGLAGPWQQVMDKLAPGATQTGARAGAATEQLENQLAQMQTAMRETRAAGLKAAQTLAESYAALASGVLIGMADALRQGAAEPSDDSPRATRRK
ncbi:DUF6781 family protein [Aquabacterium sp. OR-4]|uniref:DUF6781 family protein n=1 Tax=Aquabacterium sp. OR-4 TaxID=2978127 RepID=UPI0021B2AC01|nr:DUF6781 family protein [Aquabacterium sp. OR-4]MDT7835641.1 DUF6781 family protein [Aquabacterium sp. OR-4]